MSTELPVGIGSSYELTTEPVTRTQIVRFAGAGGDFNPLHHDEEFARAAGQPSVFAMGQLAAAMLARLAADWLGAGRLRSLSVRFTAKVWPGDVLTLRGVVEQVDPEAETGVRRRVACALTATNQRSEVVARGTTSACYGVNDR